MYCTKLEFFSTIYQQTVKKIKTNHTLLLINIREKSNNMYKKDQKNQNKSKNCLKNG